MYTQTAAHFIKMLGQLNQWIDKAEEYSKTKKFETSVLMQSRLAPDMYDFIEQIQSVCDAAKFCSARLTGKEAPKHEDNEVTIDEARQRIHKCVTFLQTLKPEDFKGCETRQIQLPYLEGQVLTGEYYAVNIGIPNFYFHLTTAYAILRHNGVDIGKKDYMGDIRNQA